MSERKEIPWIHVVRVLACLLVVCLHVSTAAADYPLTHIDNAFKHLVYLLTKPCVPLFLMVTGFLILPYQNGDDFMSFYRKRIPRVWFPLIVWSVVYAILPFCLGMVGWQAMVKEVLLCPIKQPDFFGGILWYLYILIGIYLFIPFLTERMYESRRHLHVYLLLWVVSALVMVIKAHVPNVFGENHWVHVFDMFLYFSGYLGFLLFGFAVRTYGEPMVRLGKIRLGGGKTKYLILAVMTWLVSYKFGIFVQSFLSIGTIAVTASVFMLLRNVHVNINGWAYRLLKQVSALSFGIYLCHMFVLKVFTERIFAHLSAAWHWQLLAMAATFTGAYLMSWLISQLPFKKYIIG